MARSMGRYNIPQCRSAKMLNLRPRPRWCRSPSRRGKSNSALKGRACRLSNLLIESNRTQTGCRGSLRRSTVHRLCLPRPEAEVTKVSAGSDRELELSAARNLALRGLRQQERINALSDLLYRHVDV